MDFIGSVAATRMHDRRTWFVVHSSGLVGRREGNRLILPNDAEVAAMGIDPDDAHRLGSLDGSDALTIPIAPPSRRRSRRSPCAPWPSSSIASSSASSAARCTPTTG